jgi:hypothetical protein
LIAVAVNIAHLAGLKVIDSSINKVINVVIVKASKY